MSRAFVKEDDLTAAPPTPERPRSGQPNYLTAAGLERLRARLANLNAERDSLPATLSAAERETALARLDRELRYLGVRIASATVIAPPARPQLVSFGCRVRIDDGHRTHWVAIVGEDEAEPAAGRIAWTAPLARALAGARVGEQVTWRRPVGDLEVEVLAIEPLVDQPPSADGST